MSEFAAAPVPKTKRVVAGLLLRADEILCCQRCAGQAHPFKWEFPGGKIEPGETPEQALARELDEELAIRAEIGPRVALITHAYSPEVIVELHFFRIDRWTGEIKNLIFEDVRWTPLRKLNSLDFLEADLELVRDISNGTAL